VTAISLTTERLAQVTRQATATAFVIVVNLFASGPGVAEEDAPSALERQGVALADRMCAPCHAIGKTGASPHAGAPAFRDLGNRVDLDEFPHRLREGVTSGHPDMPTFRFSREDARALTAYLRSIQAQ
jgi:mono/diheme cytochrome c family protein